MGADSPSDRKCGRHPFKPNSRQMSAFDIPDRSFSKALNKEFFNVEYHRTLDDAKLRASALMWQIWNVEAV